MHPGIKTWVGAMVAPGFVIAAFGWQASYGDEPSRLGRLFRFGGSSSSSSSSSSSPGQLGSSAASRAQASNSSSPSPSPYLGPGSSLTSDPQPAMVAPADGAPIGPSPRLVPQPRVSRPATESDPIVTRVALTRSNDGNQFGMFLQVYADGTVIDSEGVHHLSQKDLKPITDVLATGDLYRSKGYCGAPATDYVEQVYMVVYERSLGRLKANAFSYSGNPQGCDHAVRHLHTALDGLQAKLSRPASPVANVPAASTPFPASPAPVNTTGSTIPLTPIN